MHAGGEKGRQQQRNGGAGGPQDPGPDPKGEARDKIGEAIGISGKSYERGKKVVEEIDRAEAEGEQERAEHLRKVLNDKGFKPAAVEVNKTQATTQPATEEIKKKKRLPDHDGWITMAEWEAMAKKERDRYRPYVLLGRKVRKRRKEDISILTLDVVELPDGQQPPDWDQTSDESPFG